MEPVLIVAIILLFASSVIVDGIVQAIGQALRPAMRVLDNLVHRPVTYRDTSVATYRVRQAPARSAILR